MVPLAVISLLVALCAGILGFSFMSGGAAIAAQLLFIIALLTGVFAAAADAIHPHHPA